MEGSTELVMACDVCLGINSDRCPVCGKEPQYEECPDCKGEGTIYIAYHINGVDETRVTALAYACLPATEEEARYLKKNWYQGEDFRCTKCWGEGKILVEEEDREW